MNQFDAQNKTQQINKASLFFFLKSNSFIHILQSFIHGYVIIYFSDATLQVSLFQAVMTTTATKKKYPKKINNGEVLFQKNDSLYNSFFFFFFFLAKRGREERVSHFGTWIDLSSPAPAKKKNKTKGKQKG